MALLSRPYVAPRSESVRVHLTCAGILLHFFRLNTFTAALVHDLIKAYDLFDRDDQVRVVVLTAEPTAPAFCAGVGSIPIYALKHYSNSYVYELGRH